MTQDHRAPARWSLPDNPSLDWLRRRAKQLRRAVADPGDERHAEAIGLVAVYDPPPPEAGGISLARAQRVLARAFGFAGWSRLREHLAVIEHYGRPMDPEGAGDDRVDRFLRLACLTYTEPEVADRAMALLHEDPSLATASVHTMAACARVEELARLLAEDPSAATREGGPHRWPPLLYLCYARLGIGDPVATLRLLLAGGADPDSGFLWQGFPSAFTALTGVLGGGERDEPPHPQAVALAEMLLEAGADPNDNQAFYNRMFRPDDSHLGPLLGHGSGRPHPSPWRDRLGAAYPTAEEMVGEHLRSAAEKGYTDRVRRLLDHGIDPNTSGYHPILGDQTAYEMAVRNGHPGAAALLRDAGGRSDRIDEVDLLLSAALSGDRATVEALPRLWPEAQQRRPDAMAVAAEGHGEPALDLLLAIGFGIDAAGPERRTALHAAALEGDVQLCRWLLTRGADRTIEDRDYSSTPAGWAEHAGHPELAGELGPDAPTARA
jgi:Ankyrin repeat